MAENKVTSAHARRVSTAPACAPTSGAHLFWEQSFLKCRAAERCWKTRVFATDSTDTLGASYARHCENCTSDSGRRRADDSGGGSGFRALEPASSLFLSVSSSPLCAPRLRRLRVCARPPQFQRPLRARLYAFAVVVGLSALHEQGIGRASRAWKRQTLSGGQGPLSAV